MKTSAVRREEGGDITLLPPGLVHALVRVHVVRSADRLSNTQAERVEELRLQKDLSEAAYREGRRLQRANQLRQLTVCCQHSDAAPPPSVLPFPPIFFFNFYLTSLTSVMFDLLMRQPESRLNAKV